MPRTRIKICGITRIRDAHAAAAAGCDALGFVFWPGSKRYIASDSAAAIVRALPPTVTAVGVFVDATVETVARYAAATGIAAAQLCGTLPSGPWADLARSMRLIRAVPVGTGPVSPGSRVTGFKDYLFDRAKPGVPGGSGEVFDWTQVESARSWGRIWLAGGLDADNIGAAVATVRPYAVDVSTGVEDSPGIKSAEKIAAFIAAVHDADAKAATGEAS